MSEDGMKASDRAAIIRGTGAYYKCTKCREMVTKEGMESHECSPVADICHNKEAELRGMTELAYLRGKQYESDMRRQKERMAREAPE